MAKSNLSLEEGLDSGKPSEMPHAHNVKIMAEWQFSRMIKLGFKYHDTLTVNIAKEERDRLSKLGYEVVLGVGGFYMHGLSYSEYLRTILIR